MINLYRSPRNVILAAVIICAAGTVSMFAQNKTVNVVFPKGKTESTISGNIRGYGTQRYTLRAKSGQTLSAALSDNSNNAVYFNVLKGKDPIAADANEIKDWSGALPADGSYTVEIYLVRSEARRNRNATYKLTISVN